MKTKKRRPARDSLTTVPAAPPPESEAPHRQPGFRWLLLLGLVLATAAVYRPILDHQFLNYDDDFYVTDNPAVRWGLSGQGIAWAFTSTFGANWFPLTWLSWLLDYELWGMEARGFLLGNLILHCSSVGLTFWVWLRMTGAVWKSAFVAAIFALHPLHVESVAWVAERKDVLSGVFWMLTLLAYARYVERRCSGRYALVAVSLAVGLMAKPMLVSLPFVLVLLDGWPLGRLETAGHIDVAKLRKAFLEKLPFFALSVASSVVTYLVQREAGAVQALERFSFLTRVLNALNAYAGYLEKSVWPRELSVYYPHPGDAVSVGGALAGGAMLAGISFVAWRTLRTHPYLAVGWFWFAGTLVPVIGLVQVGQQAMADRYMYLPLMGLAVAVAWSVPAVLARRGTAGQRAVWRGAGAMLILVLAIATRAQARVWRDSVTLFQHTLSVTRENALAHLNLGVALMNLGRHDEGARHLEEAIRIHPGSAEAHANLGVVRARQGQPREALEHFSTALRLDPASASHRADFGRFLIDQGEVNLATTHLLEAVNLDPLRPELRNHLAAALIELGRYDEAEGQLRTALTLEPSQPRTLHNLGLVLTRLGRNTEAIEYFRQAVSANPGYAEAQFGWGLALVERGDFDEAIVHFREAAALDPDDPEIANHWGLALAHTGRLEEAVLQFRRSVSLKLDYPDAHYGLGLTLARMGDFTGAADHFQKAAALQASFPEAHLSWGLALVRQGRTGEAFERFREALSLRPDYAQAHNAWGLALSESGLPAEAEKHFRAALALEPDLAETHNHWAMALARQGKTDEAASHFRKAVALDEENPDAHNNLGVFLAQQGNLAEAVESFRRAVALSPDHESARDNLEKTLAALPR